MPGTLQVGTGVQRPRSLQERFREPRSTLLWILGADRRSDQHLLRQKVDLVGPIRSEGRGDAPGVLRLLQERAQARDHHVVAGSVHAVFLLHAESQAAGAPQPAHVGSSHEGLQEEAGAARQGAGLRTVLQRRGRQRR